jgi:3-oxoadipate enol-lactonase
MPLATKRDIGIYYESHGTGRPIVFISGLGQKSAAWQFQVPYFSDRMRVITLDNRGTGKSSRPDYPYTMDMYIGDVAAVLDSLGISEPVTLCGLSMGGMISQNFALKYPERVCGLILISTSMKVDASPLINGIRFLEGLEEKKRVWSTFAVYYSKPFRDRLRADPELLERLASEILADETRVRDYENQAAAVTTSHDTTGLANRITAPVLIIAGTGDLLIHPDHSSAMTSTIPRARLEIIEGAGHVLNIEAHEKVNTLIDDFINRGA